MSRLKKGLLEELSKGTVSLQAAARSIGRDPRTVYRWRAADPEFDAQVRAAAEESDKVRVALVEDSYFARLVSGKASAAEMIFFLTNRDPERWKHWNHRKAEGSGRGRVQGEQTATVTFYTPDTGRDSAVRNPQSS
jgi:hypothetical protein